MCQPCSLLRVRRRALNIVRLSCSGARYETDNTHSLARRELDDSLLHANYFHCIEYFR
jgi:hypothetical protein